VDPSENIGDVLQKLFANQILSVPVVDKKANLIGCIGIIDIVNFTLNVCQTGQELAHFFGFPVQETNEYVNFDQIKNYLKPENNVQQTVPSDSAQFITNFSHQNLLTVLQPNCSFRDVVAALTKSHRIAIGDDSIQNYVSQSEVVKLLAEKNAFAPFGSKTLKELNLGNNHVIHVKENVRVVEAFKLMIINKISGVAVVNDQNQLIGQISSSDIRNISKTGEMVQRLYETYAPYRKNLVEKYQAPEKLITVHSGSQFSEVLDVIVKNRLHRIFVVGENSNLESVISLTDLLKLIQ